MLHFFPLKCSIVLNLERAFLEILNFLRGGVED